MELLNVLKQRHLTLLWSARVLSAIGDRLFEIAVVWLSVQLTGAQAGFVLAAGAVSRLVFGLIGGVYADRWNRRTVMVTADLLSALTVLSLPAADLFGDVTLVHLGAVAAVVGGLSAFFIPALQASLPALAPQTGTLNALNGLMDMTERLARIVGPGLAGLLLAVMPISQFFTVDALTFLASAGAILSLGRRFAWRAEASGSSGGLLGSFFADLGAAWRYLTEKHYVLWCLLANGFVNLLWSASFVVGVALLTDRTLQLGAGAYGLIISAYGVGNVLSNLVVSNLVVTRRTQFFFAGKLVLGVGTLALAFAPNLPVAMLAAAFAAVGGPMGDLMLLLMLQEEFPAHAIGKLYSMRMTLASGGGSLGLVLASPLFSLLSVPVGLALCALLILALGASGLVRFRALPPKLRMEVPSD